MPERKIENQEPSKVDGTLIASRPICGANKKRGAGICRSIPMKNGRCRVHGGATPGGMALPQYKHGRYSKYLPTGLADKYNEALLDTELVTLRDDIALVDSQIQERMEQGKENPITFTELQPMIEQRRRLLSPNQNVCARWSIR
jgi:hypothetical protein